MVICLQKFFGFTGPVCIKMVEKNRLSFDPFGDFFVEGSPVPDDPDSRVDLRDLTMFQRTLLVTEGTLEKFLEAWMLEPIRIQNISQEESKITKDLPLLEVAEGERVFKRQVLLTGKYSGTPYVFAKSLFSPERIGQDLMTGLEKSELGLGRIIRENRIETYFQMIYYGKTKAGEVGKYFHIDKSEQLLFRKFRIFVAKKPAALITENFPITLAT